MVNILLHSLVNKIERKLRAFYSSNSLIFAACKEILDNHKVPLYFFVYLNQCLLTVCLLTFSEVLCFELEYYVKITDTLSIFALHPC